ncbi:unnamed protein product [Citrullus colocynthis]|uniref:Uncharacterized protein n=1 Tax=Citrullus colocynthis TaxID=252529 RepID=A0ABP0YUI4_9ROSI
MNEDYIKMFHDGFVIYTSSKFVSYRIVIACCLNGIFQNSFLKHSVAERLSFPWCPFQVEKIRIDIFSFPTRSLKSYKSERALARTSPQRPNARQPQILQVLNSQMAKPTCRDIRFFIPFT